MVSSDDFHSHAHFTVYRVPRGYRVPGTRVQHTGKHRRVLVQKQERVEINSFGLFQTFNFQFDTLTPLLTENPGTEVLLILRGRMRVTR